MPGVGKTTLALAFSRVLSLDMKRVQCTPDVMPSDITGFAMYRQDAGEFVLRKGSVFCNLFLADELNRTSPKTQSALLETMEEKQVTVDGETYELPVPFLVIATQNPYGSSGTLPLPLSELDRFMASLSMGYPDFANEVKLVMEAGSASRAEAAVGVMTAEEFAQAQNEVQQVYIKDVVAEYLLRLITVTRESAGVDYPASPRAAISLAKLAKASAYLAGRDYVTPRDVREQFAYAVGHRIFEPSVEGRDADMRDRIVKEILEAVKEPRTDKG